jgi:hypothetical protein
VRQKYTGREIERRTGEILGSPLDKCLSVKFLSNETRPLPGKRPSDQPLRQFFSDSPGHKPGRLIQKGRGIGPMKPWQPDHRSRCGD